MVEAGWKEALSAIREGEGIRTNAMQGRLDVIERRYRLVARTLAAMVVVTLAVVVLGLALLGSQQRDLDDVVGRLDTVVQQQRASRQVAVTDSCRALNQVSLGIKTFVRQVAPKTLPRAERLFPVRPNCAAYAHRVITEEP